jgi:hypothetical protein
LPVATQTNAPVNIDTTDAQEKLITELFPIVVSQFGVGLKVFTNLIAAHTEGDIREAVKITEKGIRSKKHGQA